MRRGLRLRLALTHAAVAALAVVVVALVVNVTGSRRFEQYVGDVREQRNQAVVRTLADTYQAAGGEWNAQAVFAAGRVAALNDVNLAVYAADGRLLFTVEGMRAGHGGMMGQMGPGMMGGAQQMQGRPSRDQLEVRSYPLEVDGTEVATVEVFQLREPRVAAEDSYTAALNRNLLIGALVAAVLALLVSVVVSRRITGPLEELTDAAQDVAGGNLDVRVAPRGDDEVAALAGAFNRMADALARDEQWRRDMTADLSHELRTPLATIQSRVEALEDGVLPPTPENLRVIGDEVERLGRLLGALRSLNEMETEDFAMRLEPIDLAAVVRDAVTRADPAYARAGVALTPALEAVTVRADRDRLLQVLANLLDNARKYSEEGAEVTVRVVADERRPEARAAGAWARVVVADEGPGIDPVDLPFVFDRFYRSRAAGVTQGVGLGLAIARGLVDAHGGVVEARNREAGGAELIVWLPRAG